MATDLGSKVMRESRSRSDADLFSPFSKRANRNSVPQKFDAQIMKSIVPKLQSSLASLDEESNPSSAPSENEPEDSMSMSRSAPNHSLIQQATSNFSIQDQVPTARSESSEVVTKVHNEQKNTNNIAISSSHSSTRKRINSHKKTKSSSKSSSTSKNSEKYHDVANDSQSTGESRENMYSKPSHYSYTNGANNNKNHGLPSSHLDHSASSSHASKGSHRGYDINLNYTNNNLPVYNPVTDGVSVSSVEQQKDSSSSLWELNGEIRRARDEKVMGTPEPGSRNMRQRRHHRSRSESSSRRSELKAEQSSRNEYSKGTASSDEDDSASEVRRKRMKRRLNSKILSEDKNKRLLFLQSDEVQKNFKDLSTFSNRFQV